MDKLTLRQRTGRCVEMLMPDGKWRSTGKMTKDEARTWYYSGGNYAGITLKEFAKDFFTCDEVGSFKFMQLATNRHTSEEWWKQNDNHLKNYILPRFGNELLTQITTPMIQDWYLSLQGKHKPLRPDSKRKILGALIHILDWAVFREIIQKNPARNVIKIRIAMEGRMPYTDFELHRMFPKDREGLEKVWGSLKWACFFMVMRDTGWRPGEIAGLKKEGIIPEYKGIYTSQSVNSYTLTIQNRIKTTDNGYKYKVGLLSDETLALIQEISADKKDDDLVFLTDKGTLIATSTSCKHFRESCERIGIDTRSRPQYSMRTTFMTNASKTLDREVVEELMGHRQWRACYDKRTPEDIVRKVSLKTV